jgi:hypothetical protein
MKQTSTDSKRSSSDKITTFTGCLERADSKMKGGDTASVDSPFVLTQAFIGSTAPNPKAPATNDLIAGKGSAAGDTAVGGGAAAKRGPKNDARAVGSTGSSWSTYQLQGSKDDFKTYENQRVEVSGTLRGRSTVKVISVRAVPGECSVKQQSR